MRNREKERSTPMQLIWSKDRQEANGSQVLLASSAPSRPSQTNIDVTGCNNKDVWNQIYVRTRERCKKIRPMMMMMMVVGRLERDHGRARGLWLSCKNPESELERS